MMLDFDVLRRCYFPMLFDLATLPPAAPRRPEVTPLNLRTLRGGEPGRQSGQVGPSPLHCLSHEPLSSLSVD